MDGTRPKTLTSPKPSPDNAAGAPQSPLGTRSPAQATASPKQSPSKLQKSSRSRQKSLSKDESKLPSLPTAASRGLPTSPGKPRKKSPESLTKSSKPRKGSRSPSKPLKGKGGLKKTPGKSPPKSSKRVVLSPGQKKDKTAASHKVLEQPSQRQTVPLHSSKSGANVKSSTFTASPSGAAASYGTGQMRSQQLRSPPAQKPPPREIPEKFYKNYCLGLLSVDEEDAKRQLCDTDDTLKKELRFAGDVLRQFKEEKERTTEEVTAEKANIAHATLLKFKYNDVDSSDNETKRQWEIIQIHRDDLIIELKDNRKYLGVGAEKRVDEVTSIAEICKPQHYNLHVFVAKELDVELKKMNVEKLQKELEDEAEKLEAERQKLEDEAEKLEAEGELVEADAKRKEAKEKKVKADGKKLKAGAMVPRNVSPASRDFLIARINNWIQEYCYDFAGNTDSLYTLPVIYPRKTAKKKPIEKKTGWRM